VLVAGVAPQLERTARRGGVGRERLGVVARGARDPGHAQPGGGELRRVAREVGAGRGVDDCVAREPHDAAVLGVPVALVPLHVHLHARRGYARLNPGDRSGVDLAMRSLRIAAAIAACAAALALPACGSDDDEPARGADATATPTPDQSTTAY
jgi:hypothetical protein